jgi:arylsulfatase A
VLLAGSPSFAAATTTTEKPRPPNIVFMLADNLGYEDVSWLATTKHNRTPHIDSIGRSGLTLHNWNSAAHLCSASRAALLTGLYPARTGVYPGVFEPDAASGLQPNTTTTIATVLKERAGYATAIVGKWHLGHRPAYLPTTNHGFDEWLGIPYHMSGGSLDNHTCAYDTGTAPPQQWLPLYQDDTIVQQPVRVQELAATYATAATNFIQRNAAADTPFFLYMAFSHVHQLCASADRSEQTTCQWAARNTTSSSDDDKATFDDAVAEMDWIVGQIVAALHDASVAENTLVIFTSDNGPWLAEQSCSGLRGPFAGQWYVCRWC